ncbi:bifunctional 5,10-methylenetetrahydrofolate dehydrogenase/5,10-methenyltetrahydrofolate cyclohydrolase [Martelella alba]|uniref:Bifunctional protein FolD n=1 Tax=Martelella alba TaxID=2590451 RepID=A0A506U942_9HYPH|nr:bifunctional 5,10-methylenetetrahydrofolate dehydrogenase/5,10-methenyltetrahydrofolate cyclohydrolase [Martelella alba]TPW29099.1 bifunctional 5,10-methylenetetrahydrofolate dehydrogenase/5,10-methenyltetrahydrofolate cyclohydrolase [Martelella alba]
MTGIFRADRLAAERIASTRTRLAAHNLAPLAVILLDACDAGMKAYGQRLADLAGEAGVRLRFEPWPATPDDCYRRLQALADEPEIDAIAPLYPLPTGVSAAKVATLIGADRDIDGLHPENAGRLALGYSGRFPATAMAVAEIAEHLAGPLAGQHVVLIGASRIVGRPLTQMLLDREATVTIAHAATRDLAAHTRAADIIVSAAGKPGLIGADDIAEGAILIDVAINRTAAGLVGDVDLEAVMGKAAIITHVPDGVGPLTTAYLFTNIADAALAGTTEGKDLSI